MQKQCLYNSNELESHFVSMSTLILHHSLNSLKQALWSFI